MKKLALSLLLSATALSAQAQIDVVALQKYIDKLLPSCPGSVLKLDRLDRPGPSGFLLFGASQTSSDTNCAARKFVLISPSTEQILVGEIIPLPDDTRRLEDRVAEQAAQILKKQVVVRLDRAPVPDGLKAVSILKPTSAGPFPYHGYIDASGKFLIIGFRGNLRVEPGRTLLDAVGAPNGVQRGSRTAKVEIVELSDLECPTCARVHKELEPIIAKNLSRISYTRLDLPLFENHQWSLRAALGAHGIQKAAPSKYWAYVNYVFENQETIGKTDFDKFLKNYCEDHDIDWKAVEKIYKSPVEKAAILDAVSRAFDNGINSTPTLIVNGQQIGFANDGKYTLETVKKAITGK